MADGSGRTTKLRRDYQTLFREGTVAGFTDGELLDRFLRGSAAAECAFGALVERHGPMVYRVCRQIAGNAHDAQDAAQATFLVLARKARAIRRADSVASWLYGVACRIASRARADAARRHRRERRVEELPAPVAAADREPESWPELYEELGRLPERFRLPIVLCHLEGLTHQQAAEQLRCPVRTIQSRLARGRERLRARLVRRGVGASVALLAAALTSEAGASAWFGVGKTPLVALTVPRAASGTFAGGVSVTAAALAQGTP